MDTPLPLARKLSLCLRRFFVFHNIRIYSLWFYLPLERHNWACNLMTSDEKLIRYPFPYSVTATLESALKSPERSLPSTSSLFIHFPSFFRFFIASQLFCNHITHCFWPITVIYTADVFKNIWIILKPVFVFQSLTNLGFIYSQPIQPDFSWYSCLNLFSRACRTTSTWHYTLHSTCFSRYTTRLYW